MFSVIIVALSRPRSPLRISILRARRRSYTTLRPWMTARAALEAFVSAPDAPARADAFVALIQTIRPQGDGTWKESAVRPLLEVIEPAGETRDRFGVALATLLSDIDPTNLVGVAGIPGHRGFFSEFGDRLANHLLPSPRAERDLRELTRRLYRTERDARLLGDAPLDLFHRVAAALVSAPPPDAWRSVRVAFADGFRLLLTRIESEGLSPKVRARATAGPVSASPFHRVGAAGDALVAAWSVGR